jgi:hypothetical protein
LPLRACGSAGGSRGQRDEPGFLDRLAQRRVRGHPVGHGLDRRLGVDRNGAGLDQVGHVRPDHDQPEQLAVRVSWIDFTQPTVSPA